MNEHVHICALTLHPPKPAFMHLPIKAARQFWVGLFEKAISDAWFGAKILSRQCDRREKGTKIMAKSGQIQI